MPCSLFFLSQFFSYPGNLWLLKQQPMLLLPLLLTLPSKFFFISFLSIYCLFHLYTAQSKYSMKVGSPLPLLSAHNQPPPPSCHLDPTSPGFVSTDRMPSKRTNRKMKVMKGEKMRRLKMKMRTKMRKKVKVTKTTTMRQHQHQHPAPLLCPPPTP